MTKVAIIGAGISGLACARALYQNGVSPIVFDKGRGIGGRVATRRADGGLQFDHGAQYLTAKGPDFASVLSAAAEAGAVERWGHGNNDPSFVGSPGMTAFAKWLGNGIHVRQKNEIVRVTLEGNAWRVSGVQDAEVFDRVICTAPAPQTDMLVGHHLPQHADISVVRYDPSLTLMVALKRRPSLPASEYTPITPFAWVVKDSAKPRRPEVECWVAQASAEWSVTHLNKTKEDICALMLDLFLGHAGLTDGDVSYATAHRWRYAFVTNPIGVPFLKNSKSTLYAGGDWCLGPRVEHAWQSGNQMAANVLALE